jgi:hypothetical protein
MAKEIAIDTDINLQEIATLCKGLREAADRELRSLSENFGDMTNWADMADATTFDREDGVSSMALGGFNFRTAFSMALMRPSDTATAYLVEQQRRMIVAASRAFCRLNPYWLAAKNARIAYNVGVGHTYSVVSRTPGEDVDKALARKVMKELNLFLKLNQYRKRQGEKLTRGDRDGEYFLRFIEDRPDGVLRVRFIEPLLIQDPPGKSAATDTWFGVQFDGNDYEEPTGYYIKPSTYDGGMTDTMNSMWSTMIPATEIQHCKFNVDMSSPRGIPTTYSLRGPLTQALSTATSMGRLVDIRARVAMIRKQVNATLGQIQPLLLRNRSGQVSQGNVTKNVFGMSYGTIFDTNDQRSYEFPSQNLETDKIVASVKTDLQSAAAALGFADFVLNADSGANFAGALVKEGPMEKAVGCSQQDLIDDDIEIFERALQVAADHGRLDADILEQVTINAQPPCTTARNRIQDAQADEIYIRNGALSTETMSEKGGFDPDVEMARIKANPPPGLVAAQAAAQAASNPGNGDTRSHQAPKQGKPTARGVPAGREPGPGANPQKASEGLEEHASDMRSQDTPTQEDFAMSALIITPEWLSQTKAEILGLPRTALPTDPASIGDYEPGVKGMYLGMVDNQQVWACDFDAMMVKYSLPDLVVAGNSEKWPAIPYDKIIVDWSYSAIDKAHNLLHECCEFALMSRGKWAYGRAHKMANVLEQAFLLELRPELAALKPE